MWPLHPWEQTLDHDPGVKALGKGSRGVPLVALRTEQWCLQHFEQILCIGELARSQVVILKGEENTFICQVWTESGAALDFWVEETGLIPAFQELALLWTRGALNSSHQCTHNYKFWLCAEKEKHSALWERLTHIEFRLTSPPRGAVHTEVCRVCRGQPTKTVERGSRRSAWKTKCGKDRSSFLNSREIGVAGPAPQGDKGLEMEAAATC